jgi:CheY-like chemotaxis protein
MSRTRSKSTIAIAIVGSVIFILALTANAFDEDVQRSLQAGLNAHLTKPIQPEVLFETLESLLKTGDKSADEGGN